MSRLIKDIKDKNTGQLVYPRTHLSAVVVDETTNLENLIGTNVGSRLNQLETTLEGKVDKVTGKQLSTEDFTSDLKTKLEGLSNYDDAAIQQAVAGLQTQLNALVSGDAGSAIESFNEIIAFLDGVEDTETLDGIIASIEQQIAGKQSTITDLSTIREGASAGATAVQPSSLSDVATSGSYSDLKDKPIQNQLYEATSEDGANFSITIPDVSSMDDLYGRIIVINPIVGSASSNCNLQVNDLASVAIRRNDDLLSHEWWGFPTATWMAANVPIPVMYNGTYWKVMSMSKPYASDLNGTVPVDKGGTGATTAAAALAALGGQATLVSGTNIKTINGTSLLGSGDIEVGSPTIDSFQTRTGTTHSISSFAANTVYSCIASGNTTKITISKFADPTPTTRAAYYTIVFKATSCTFTVPSTVMWVGGNAIEFDSSTAYTYEVNFMKIQLSAGVRYLATWNRY